jgi:hypothetical protein
MKNNQTMLELSKKILSKVSFDRSLFRKELAKSLNWIHSKEKTMFQIWVLSKFGKKYKKYILEIYNDKVLS